jgi:hypothetical protein
VLIITVPSVNATGHFATLGQKGSSSESGGRAAAD